MTKRLLLQTGLILGAGIIFIAINGCGKESAEDGEMPPPPVTVVSVEPQDLEITATYPGRIQGLRDVQVRARVGGILEKRLYDEGRYVEKGDPLFQIDREPYEVALKQAEAQRANARANLNQARREWERISELYEQNAISTREYDRALSARELAEAQMQSAVSTVAEAELNLDYTTVTAPLSGSTDLEHQPEGSLIERGALLTTIVQHDPAQVRFAIPERDAATQRTARAALEKSGAKHRYEVHLLRSGAKPYKHPGIVDFTDSTIHPQTGSVQARAIFDNPEQALIPGQFVRVQIRLQHLKSVFVIDPAAVSEGPDGPRIFALNPDNTVRARNVELGPIRQGKQVVLSGLEAGDRIITNGLVNLQPGMTVTPQDANGGE